MRAMWAVIGVALVAQAAGGAMPPGVAFNLLCTGQKTFSQKVAGYVVKDFTKPVTERYRINLANRRWCADDCSETVEIAGVSHDSLSLVVHVNDGLQWFIDINRQTGAWSYYLENERLRAEMEGHCVRQPFTGHPRRKF